MLLFQGVKLRLERVLCKCDATWCSTVCKVKFISRERAEYNAAAKLHKTLNYIGYHAQTFYKGSNNEYRPMLLDVRDDYCESYVKHSKMLDFLLGLFEEKNFNFNKPCPWYPGDYYIKDFNFNIVHWPSIIPEGRYILNFTFYRGPNLFLGYYQIYFAVTNHGLLDLRVG